MTNLAPKPQYTYRAKIERWVDGDTADVSIDVGFRIWARQRIRLEGINTPELHPKHEDFVNPLARAAHIEKAREALMFCEESAPLGSEVILATGVEVGKYGRYIAKVYHHEDGVSLNERLVEAGLAEEKQY